MQMKRIHYLAAEIFSYSYDNYDGHLGINDRFDKLMPHDARLLEDALESDSIDAGQLAEQLGIPEDGAIEFLQRAKDARKIVDAATPAAGFREAVKQSIQVALNQGITDEAEIDALVEQICYRTADLSYLLKQRDEPLDKYSEELRVW